MKQHINTSYMIKLLTLTFVSLIILKFIVPEMVYLYMAATLMILVFGVIGFVIVTSQIQISDQKRLFKAINSIDIETTKSLIYDVFLKKSKKSGTDDALFKQEMDLWGLDIVENKNGYFIVPRVKDKIHPHYKVLFASTKRDASVWFSALPDCEPNSEGKAFFSGEGDYTAGVPKKFSFLKMVYTLRDIRLYLNTIDSPLPVLIKHYLFQLIDDKYDFQKFMSKEFPDEEFNLNDFHNFYYHYDVFVKENPDTENIPKEWVKYLYQL